MTIGFVFLLTLVISNLSGEMYKSLLGDENIKSINAQGVTGENSAQKIAGNIINNFSNISNSPSDKIQKVTDLGGILVVMLVGIILFIIQYFRRDPVIPIFLTQTDYKLREKNPYVGLSDKEIDSIASNTSRNLTSLIAAYGILLSFVVVSKIEIAFHGSVFYVWSGLILSIIIRSLLLANKLSDIAHVSGLTYQQKLANLLNSKAFLKHSALIFILIIAFTPAFALVNSEDKTAVKKYSYLGDNLILVVAISVVAITSFFLYVATLISKHIHMYYLLIAWALMLATLSLTSSPLDPTHLKFFPDSNVYDLPFIMVPVVIFGFIFSSVFITILVGRRANSYYERKKATKNKVS